MKKAPCKGCTDRMLMCHGKCEKYQDWKREMNEFNDRRFHERQRDQLTPRHIKNIREKSMKK